MYFIIGYYVETDFYGATKDIYSLEKNDIASVTFKLNKPIFGDNFKENRANGAYILLDKNSSTTIKKHSSQ